MRRALLVLLVLVCVSASVRADEEAALVGPILERGRDLNPNVGFEAATDGKPDVWRLTTRPGASPLVWGDFGLGGSKGLRFQASESAGKSGSRSGVAYVLQGAELEADMQIRVTVWVRLQDFHGACFVWARCDGERGPERREGAFQNSIQRGYAMEGSSVWSPVTVHVTTSSDTKRIVFGLEVGGQGEVRIDEFRARVAAAAPVRSPRARLGPGLYRAEGRYEAMILEDTDRLRVHVPVPILWRHQVPLSFHAWTEPAAHLGRVTLLEREHGQHVAEIELLDLKQGAKVRFAWDGYVLALPHVPTPIPSGVTLPLTDVPEEVQPWLEATWCADSEDEGIQEVVASLREAGGTADRAIPATLARMRTIFRKASGRVAELTATEALTKQGSCTSCANLGAALLRAQGIPARIVAGYPTWSGPLQTHYVVEYWLPEGGWRLMESTRCQDDRPSWEQIEVALVLPEDEAEATAGPRASAAPGVPHLSLTEYPDAVDRTARTVWLRGVMPDSPGCDHQAVKIAVYDATPDAWADLAHTMSARWQRLTAAAVADENAVQALAAPEGLDQAATLAALAELLSR